MAKKKTMKERVAEIEARIPEIRAELLKRVEQEKHQAYKKCITDLFSRDSYFRDRFPLGWHGPDLDKKSSSMQYLSSIVREYNADGIVYAGQFGVDGIGHSEVWDNGGYRRGMIFAKGAGWKAFYLWNQLDSNIDTIYTALIKIGNKWYQLNISTGNDSKIFWREGFSSKSFQY
jgi:hypothetical protein